MTKIKKIKLGRGKVQGLKNLTNEKGIINALAIDQRGSLRKMISSNLQDGTGDLDGLMREFKTTVCEELSRYCSAVLLDPEYGLEAASKRSNGTGLLLAYEKTGYDVSKPGRMPDLLEEYSVRELKSRGADAVKLLVYYDVDEDERINLRKRIFLQRLGSECLANDIPLFVEPVSYDAGGIDPNSAEYARLKPHKVITMMREFSKSEYHIDVLKVEVPVNMAFVEGFSAGPIVHSKKEAAELFLEQSRATHLPFIFLSAGVATKLFRETVDFAGEVGSDFVGVLCGRATWKEGVSVFGSKGISESKIWLRDQGRENVEELAVTLNRRAKSIFEKVEA